MKKPEDTSLGWRLQDGERLPGASAFLLADLLRSPDDTVDDHRCRMTAGMIRCLERRGFVRLVTTIEHRVLRLTEAGIRLRWKYKVIQALVHTPWLERVRDEREIEDARESDEAWSHTALGAIIHAKARIPLPSAYFLADAYQDASPISFDHHNEYRMAQALQRRGLLLIEPSSRGWWNDTASLTEAGRELCNKYSSLIDADQARHRESAEQTPTDP